MLGNRVKKPLKVAHKPPKNARLNFRRRIRTKKEVYPHFQRSRKKLQSNIKVSPLLCLKNPTLAGKPHPEKLKGFSFIFWLKTH